MEFNVFTGTLTISNISVFIIALSFIFAVCFKSVLKELRKSYTYTVKQTKSITFFTICKNIIDFAKSKLPKK